MMMCGAILRVGTLLLAFPGFGARDMRFFGFGAGGSSPLGGRSAFSAVFAVALCASLATPSIALAKEGAWREANDPISRILESRERSGFDAVPKGDDPRARRLRRLMDSAVAILSDSPIGEERSALNGISSRISAKNKEIAGLRQKMAGAPEKADGVVGGMVEATVGRLGVGQRSKESYREDVASAEREIERLRGEQLAVREEFSKKLSSIGIRLESSQLDGLLSMATAEDMIDLQSAFDGMKRLNRELLDATIRTDESLEVAKRYYGIYSVLLELACYMHEEFLGRIDAEYLPKVRGIEAEAAKLRREAEALRARQSDADLRSALDRNVAAQDLTARASALYRDRLIDQRAKLILSMHKVISQRDVAINTWRTVNLSSDLVSMMRSTGQRFETLMNLDIPAMRPFESVEMKVEFEKITAEMKAGSAKR
jgi:hypothetical protein